MARMKVQAIPESGLRLRPRFDWQLRSRRLRLGERTQVMAIVNVTPDSFSGDGHMMGGFAGARFAAAGGKLAVAAAVTAVDAGADIVDLGAESTRPGAGPLTAEQEQARLLPVLEGLRMARPDAVVSVDTYHAATARAAARAGAEIVNDVSGLSWDEAMAEAVAQSGCGLILMHTRGRPGEWATQPAYAPGALLTEVFAGLCEGVVLAESAGIATEHIVVDPGFGFGKRGTENFALLAGLGRLHELGRPLLAGLSRKRFLGEAMSALRERDGHPASSARAAEARYVGRAAARHGAGPASGIAAERFVATVAANVAAVLAGAHVLRVHDVLAAQQAAAVADAVLCQGAA